MATKPDVMSNLSAAAAARRGNISGKANIVENAPSKMMAPAQARLMEGVANSLDWRFGQMNKPKPTGVDAILQGILGWSNQPGQSKAINQIGDFYNLMGQKAYLAKQGLKQFEQAAPGMGVNAGEAVIGGIMAAPGAVDQMRGVVKEKVLGKKGMELVGKGPKAVKEVAGAALQGGLGEVANTMNTNEYGAIGTIGSFLTGAAREGWNAGIKKVHSQLAEHTVKTQMSENLAQAQVQQEEQAQVQAQQEQAAAQAASPEGIKETNKQSFLSQAAGGAGNIIKTLLMSTEPGLRYAQSKKLLSEAGKVDYQDVALKALVAGGKIDQDSLLVLAKLKEKMKNNQDITAKDLELMAQAQFESIMGVNQIRKLAKKNPEALNKYYSQFGLQSPFVSNAKGRFEAGIQEAKGAAVKVAKDLKSKISAKYGF